MIDEGSRLSIVFQLLAVVAHWRSFAVSDVLTVEVWTGRGLVTHYLLFMISLADRAVEVLGLTANPDKAWTLQVGRNAIACEGGVLRGKHYLIIRRDTKYTEQFRRLVRESGTEVIRLPPMSPNLNAYAERFVRSIKEECLNRMIFVGQASLRRLIRLCSADAANDGSIRRRQRLGGMLNFYHRIAACAGSTKFFDITGVASKTSGKDA